MKKLINQPVINIVRFEAQDIIVTSDPRLGLGSSPLSDEEEWALSAPKRHGIFED